MVLEAAQRQLEAFPQATAEVIEAYYYSAGKRLPGLVAHIHEEKTRERPMQAIHPADHEYDGPLPD